MACGAYDRDVLGRVFVKGLVGGEVSQQDLVRMNPIRNREAGKPPEKAADVRAAESRAGWAAVDRFFTQGRG